MKPDAEDLPDAFWAAALPDAATLPAVADKWALLADLRLARAALGVTDRDLVVLNALLGLLPGKELPDGPSLLVHPSNATLSDRAHGMPESTLRRHLAALVAAGLIARQDSPNGKRYALRDRSGAVVQAFGFDLRPLLARAEEIRSLAEAQRQADLLLRQRRTQLVIRLRDADKLCAYAAEQGLVVDTLEARLMALSRGLRRKMTLPQIDAALEMSVDILARITTLLSSETQEMSGNDSQRDRKVQRSVDPALYQKRDLIERFFNKIKHFRKVATRYEKSAQNYMAVVLIPSSRLWMRHYESASYALICLKPSACGCYWAIPCVQALPAARKLMSAMFKSSSVMPAQR